MFESLNLSELPKRQCGIIREPSRTRPTLWVVEENGVRAVVKDYSTNGFLYRNIIGRFLVWRENKAYGRLRGLPGIPAVYGVLDGLALVMEELPGKSLEGLERERRLPEEFFRELETLVERVHRRGIAHCDLKRAPNTLIGDDDRPYIVDWSAAILEREFRFFPLRRLYRALLQDDLNAVVKMRLRHCPESVSPEGQSRYYHRSEAEKLVRAVRDKARDLLKRIA
jgi:RIO-like serine/threonine protein kinase